MPRRLVVLLALGACGPSEGKQGECRDSLVVGDLVITEVFADFKAPTGGTGADEGKEWFEIYNASDRPIELEGLRVDHSRPNGDKLKSHVMAAVTIAPGQYFTLGNATPDLVPAYVDYGYSADLGDMFNSDGGRLSLNCGDSEIDATDYEMVKQGASRQLTASTFPDYTLNDDLANWCEANNTEFENSNFGTPGSDNDCTPVIAGLCNDSGTMREVVSPMPGQLVITEVMPNPAVVSDTTAEWFEIQALADIDLNGLAPDRAGDTSNPRPIESTDCIHLAAGERAVFAKSTEMAENGLPMPVAGTFTFSLVDGTADKPGDVQILFGTTVIDAITWTSTRSGRSHQLDPGKIDAIANDDPGAFCDGTTIYNTNQAGTTNDFGTPGEANIACPLVVPAGQCDDGTTIRNIIKPNAGDLVITEVMPAPLVLGTNGDWFEVTNVSNTPFDLNGLGIDRDDDTRKPDVVSSTQCKTVMPNTFAVIARSAIPESNGGIEGVAATFGFAMLNSNGHVQVVDPATCGDTSPFACTTIFDRAAWGSTGSASSIPRSGASGQLRSDQFTTSANDLAPTNYCIGTEVYDAVNANKGTPGAADPNCPP